MTTSDTAEHPCGETPTTDVAARGGTREEGGADPPAERRDTTRWPTPVEAEMAKAWAGTAEGGGDNTGADVNGKETGGTGVARRDKRDRSPHQREEERGLAAPLPRTHRVQDRLVG